VNTDELAHGLDWQGEDLTGWYLSEKFDGCRAFWDGARMWTRQGNEITLPDWFRDELPAGVRLDGEMWCGRGEFKRASDGVRFGRIDRSFTFCVFDAPDASGDWLARMATVPASAHVQPVEHSVCRDNASAIWRMQKVQAERGEGLIARRPGMPYAPGRSGDILKVKVIPSPAKPSPEVTTFSFVLE
jgi:DNA ligase-1